MGNGPFSRALPYKDWFEFNNAIRVHGNTLEHAAWSIPMMFLSSLFYPRLTVGLGTVVLLGRGLYTYGYYTESAQSIIREVGAVPMNVAEIFFTLSVSTAVVSFFCMPFIRRRNFYRKRFWTVYERKLDEVKDQESRYHRDIRIAQRWQKKSNLSVARGTPDKPFVIE